MKMFLTQPRVQAEQVVLETHPHLHDPVFPVVKALQLVPIIHVRKKER
ncbi:hypothetical protein PI124_g2862 [Phytophthora idaei]|nr:hypothetical protein PI125_g13657 [Phytophthora idaei]KAG3144500.1 hypothetical protein PI126_g14136 [Phytophthora idaei]KAG3252530.1 hypothetical protein PI124_g2862 [Phytophthora idaei]